MGKRIDYVITRRSDHGWSITRMGHAVGSTNSILDAIDFANQLAERESNLHKHDARVVLVDSDKPPSPEDE